MVSDSIYRLITILSWWIEILHRTIYELNNLHLFAHTAVELQQGFFKCMYQAKIVNAYVYLCLGCQFLFCLYNFSISLKLFRQCGIFVFVFKQLVSFITCGCESSVLFCNLQSRARTDSTQCHRKIRIINDNMSYILGLCHVSIRSWYGGILAKIVNAYVYLCLGCQFLFCLYNFSISLKLFRQCGIFVFVYFSFL
jgi:hypothetical protein